LPKTPKAPQQMTETVTVPVEAQAAADRLADLEAFANLVSERFGYWTARRLISHEASEKTAAERKKATEAAKEVSKAVEILIKQPSETNAKDVASKREVLKEKRKIVADARKPFNEKMKPLAQAVKICDSVAIPDALKVLGKTVVPRFSLSEWCGKAVEQTQRKD
jgi:hypothetical protein